jgi:hypothetical protein
MFGEFNGRVDGLYERRAPSGPLGPRAPEANLEKGTRMRLVSPLLLARFSLTAYSSRSLGASKWRDCLITEVTGDEPQSLSKYGLAHTFAT